MSELSIPQAFAAALDGLMRQVKQDKSILAAILCGSLSHDTVWARSDIDLVLVTVDDKKVTAGDMPIYADGVNVHAMLMPRTEFRKVNCDPTRIVSPDHQFRITEPSGIMAL